MTQSHGGSEFTNFTPGTVFSDRYEVVRCINAGGMGAVYEVIHLETRRRRAMKVMLPSIVADEAMRARFQLEARVTADIDSDHIVETFDAGIDSKTGAPFLVMELLKGRDLTAELEVRTRLPPEEVVLLLSQAAFALDKTHAASIVHRDLKPDNLFIVRRDDGSPRLKILDFGIAKIAARSAKTAKQTHSIGTPLYMSPEQIQADSMIGPRADLYAVAHIAYTLLVGEAYFEEESSLVEGVIPLLMKVSQGSREAASVRALRRHGLALPPAFDVWFARAANLDPATRFERASAMVHALGEALGAPATSRLAVAPTQPVDVPIEMLAANARTADKRTGHHTTSPTSSERAPAPSHRSAASLFVFGVLAAVVVLAGGFLGLKRLGSSEPSPQIAATRDPARATAAASAEPAPPIVEPAPTAAEAPPARAPSVEPAESAAAPTAAAPHPASSATLKPKIAAAPAHKVDCHPPFTYDADGTPHRKPECFK